MGGIFSPPSIPSQPALPPPAPPPPPPEPEPEPAPPPPAPTPAPVLDTTAETEAANAAAEAARQKREQQTRSARGWRSTVNTSYRGVLAPATFAGTTGMKTLLGD